MDLKGLFFYQRVVELFFSSICFIANIYFATRFANSTFSPNLRIILIVSHLVGATLGLLHPALQFVPEEAYSIERGKYAGALLYNSLLFVNQAAVYFFDSKLLIVVLERRVAFNQRSSYENQDGNKGRTIVFSIAALVCVVVGIKGVLMFHFLRDEPLDHKLQLWLDLERWPPGIIFAYTIASSCWLAGAWEFRRLAAQTKAHFYIASSLSESFQIKQTEAVVAALRPIIYAYGVLVVLSTPSLGTVYYDHYVLGEDFHSEKNTAIINSVYLFVSWYNTFSTVYLLLSIGHLRRALKRDLRALFGLQQQSPTVEPTRINWEEEREHHFDHLRRVWG